jgi:hypothetical protein
MWARLGTRPVSTLGIGDLTADPAGTGWFEPMLDAACIPG